MKMFKIIFFVLLILYMYHPSFAKESRHSEELWIKLTNLPGPNWVTTITAQSVDVIYADNYDPTGNYSGGTIVTDPGDTETGFDWYNDPQTSPVLLALLIPNLLP